VSTSYRIGVILWAGSLLSMLLVATRVPYTSGAEPIVVLNQSSLKSAPDEPFTATIGDGYFGRELLVTGRVAERTLNGEHLVEAVVELVVSQTDGSPIWSGSWPAAPGKHLDWRVAVQPFGVLDGGLISQVTIRDRQVITVEVRERAEREVRIREEAARAEVRRREQAKRVAEEARIRAEREAEAKRERERQAAIRAHGWPTQIESAVIEGRVTPGMTTEQVILAWGRPLRINQTTRASGVSEQWVYSTSRHVYLENGRVTAIQTSR